MLPQWLGPLLLTVVLLTPTLANSSVQAEPDSLTRDNLLIVGDSLSAGYGVPNGQEWAHLLQLELDRQGHSLVLINASISGETSAQGRARLARLLTNHQPRWVLLELGANDGLRGLSLTQMKANLSYMVESIKQAGAKPLLLGIKIPPNYGRKYTEKFEQVFIEVAQEHQVPLLPFFLDGVATDPALMQEDRIHPNATAQPRIADNVWQFLKPHLQEK